MAKIMVPEEVYPGFKIITDLTQEKIDILISYLKELSPDKSYLDIALAFDEKLNIDGESLLQTLLSFTGLYSEAKEDISLLTKNLVDSYKELSRIGINSKVSAKLKNNLSEIILNVGAINLIEKIRHYKLENSKNLRDYKLFTDIRILEDDNEKYGLLLHKIYLNYQGSRLRNELHIHLDLTDLIGLKSEIEQAIERDRKFREDFNGNIKLI